MRWAVRVAVIVAAMALVTVGGFAWKDHLTGLWGPQSASVPTLGDGGGGDGDRGGERERFREGFPGRDGAEGFTPPEGGTFTPPDGQAGFRPDGDRDGGGRGGVWFSAEGLKGFMPLLIPGVLALVVVVAWDRRKRWIRRVRTA